MTYKSQVSSRIAMLRFIMICGVVILHTPQYVPIGETGSGVFDFIKALCQQSVFRLTVPVLTFISGYLLFSSNLDQQYTKLLSKKFKTIFIPFLVFNLSLLTVVYFAETRLGVKVSYDLTTFDRTVWLNAAFGVTEGPINYPLHFLRDLIVLIVLAPVFGWLLRKASFVGLAIVMFVFLNNYDRYLIQREIMAVMFYVGGMFAVRKWDMLALDKYAGLCLALFASACVAVVYFRVANTTGLRLVGPFLLWPAASLVSGTKFEAFCNRMSKYSFFVFVSHAPILLVSWLVYTKVKTVMPYEIYWVATPAITIAMLIATYKVAMKVCPGCFGMAVGLRVKTQIIPPLAVPAN